jgi:hypothetical protein
VSWEYIAGFAVLWIASFAASVVAITVLLVNLPSTYFLNSHQRQLWIDRHRVIRWTGTVLKNLLGLFLVLLGVVLSVPGVPGQGILTAVIGLVLVDFPGKRRLEQRMLSRPHLRLTVNRLRARFGREPFVLDDHESGS